MPGITVKQATAMLQAQDQEAYLFLDDNGTGLEVVDLEGGYYSYIDGKLVGAVFLMFRGDRERSEAMLTAMERLGLTSEG